MKKRVNRKPMDKLNGFDSREAIWKVIRKLEAFSVRDIHQETTLEISSVRDYLEGLTKAGYLEKTTIIKPTLFKLIRDVGIDAPRVRKDGSAVTQGQGTANMWKAMRTLKEFTVRQLAAQATTVTCTVKASTAKDYCKHLCKAGYLRSRGPEAYFFIPHKYSGPKAPMIQRVKRVWDQNLGKVVWREDGGTK